MIPTCVAKAIHLVLRAMGTKDRPEWSQFAKIESDPGSDLFVFEATDSAMALTIAFSNPEFVDWGGVAWISEREMRNPKTIETYLSLNAPDGYPESVRDHLERMMANASDDVDIYLSTYYWGVVGRVLAELANTTRTVELTCAGKAGPLRITVHGGTTDEWIEANIFVMGLARENSA